MSPDGASWSAVVGWVFLITNAGRLLAYFPQIIAAARCDAGARSVSVLTWGYFAIAHFSALLYAIVVLRDSRSVWIFSGNLVVTLILVVIVVAKRRQHSRVTKTARVLQLSSQPVTSRDRGNATRQRGVRRPVLSWEQVNGSSGLAAAGRRQKTVVRYGFQTVNIRTAR